VKYVTQKREERREGQLIKQRVEAYIEAEKEAEMKKKMVCECWLPYFLGHDFASGRNAKSKADLAGK